MHAARSSLQHAGAQAWRHPRHPVATIPRLSFLGIVGLPQDCKTSEPERWSNCSQLPLGTAQCI